MGFSTYALLVALVAAAAGLAAGHQLIQRSRSPYLAAITALGLAAAVTAVPTMVGAITSIRSDDPDAFAVIHHLYLAATVTVPVLAAGGLIGSFIAAPSSTGRGWRVFVYRSTLVLCLVPAGVGFYATHIEPFNLRVDEHQLPLGDDQLAGSTLRLGVLSDLQTNSIDDYERDVVAQLIAAEPDVVLIPGDLYQFGPGEFDRNREDFTALLRTIVDAGIEIVQVHGDTDSPEGLGFIIEGTGVHFLQDEVLRLNVGGTDVVIGGINLAKTPGDVDPAVVAELAAAPATAATILLSHRPDAVGAVTPGSIDLVVAGHTHGGQIALPFFGPPITNSALPRHIGAGGLHDYKGQAIYVSTGVGRERQKAPQVRIGVRPSIGIIDLVG